MSHDIREYLQIPLYLTDDCDARYDALEIPESEHEEQRGVITIDLNLDLDVLETFVVQE